MIVNKFGGRCPCGQTVPPGRGFVLNRRIVCADHGGEAQASRDEDRAAMADTYDDREIYGFDSF